MFKAKKILCKAVTLSYSGSIFLMEDLEIVKIRLSKIDIIYYVPNGGYLVVSKYINFDSSLIIMPPTFKYSNSVRNCRYLTFVYFPLWVDYK